MSDFKHLSVRSMKPTFTLVGGGQQFLHEANYIQQTYSFFVLHWNKNKQILKNFFIHLIHYTWITIFLQK